MIYECKWCGAVRNVAAGTYSGNPRQGLANSVLRRVVCRGFSGRARVYCVDSAVLGSNVWVIARADDYQLGARQYRAPRVKWL